MKKGKGTLFWIAVIMAAAIFAVMPKMAIDVHAASSPSIQVEQGEEFYIGDYFMIYGRTDVTASMVKASYSSSNPSVAAVDGKGYFIAKETGITKITVKYKKWKETETIEVVPTGTFEKTDATVNLKMRVQQLASQIPSSISLKNGYRLNKLAKDYVSANSGNISYISNDGFLQKKTRRRELRLNILGQKNW